MLANFAIHKIWNVLDVFMLLWVTV